MHVALMYFDQLSKPLPLIHVPSLNTTKNDIIKGHTCTFVLCLHLQQSLHLVLKFAVIHSQTGVIKSLCLVQSLYLQCNYFIFVWQ